MTAPRNCRACGAALPGDVRWCLRCYEPVTELTARAPMWAPGEFVDNLVHRGGAVPHWSRWERSTTTLGPWGRIGLTVGLFLTLPLAFSFGMFLYLIWFPVVAIVGVRGIWAKGWVVPGEAEAPVRPAAVERRDVHPEPPMTKAMIAWRAAWMGAVLAGCLLFAYWPSATVKAVVLAVATLFGLYFFWRGSFTR